MLYVTCGLNVHQRPHWTACALSLWAQLLVSYKSIKHAYWILRDKKTVIIIVHVHGQRLHQTSFRVRAESSSFQFTPQNNGKGDSGNSTSRELFSHLPQTSSLLQPCSQGFSLIYKEKPWEWGWASFTIILLFHFSRRKVEDDLSCLDWDEALSRHDVDAFVICTENDTHAEYARWSEFVRMEDYLQGTY